MISTLYQFVLQFHTAADSLGHGHCNKIYMCTPLKLPFSKGAAADTVDFDFLTSGVISASSTKIIATVVASVVLQTTKMQSIN